MATWLAVDSELVDPKYYYVVMLDALMGLLAPHTCIVCGKEGSLLCTWCAPDALEVLPERCYRCNAVSPDAAVCMKCRRLAPLKYVWIRALYKDTAKELVYRLKFARTKSAAQQIAELLEEIIPALPAETIVTYIPTATSRVRQRGYDQTRLIAKAVAKSRGLTCTHLLVRHGQARQVGADRKHRIDQAAKNYTATNGHRIKGAHILLIDDILTTGATIEAAAKVLRKAGAKTINAAIFAQKQ